MLNDAIEKVLVSEEELKEKVTSLGQQITKDYAGKNLLMVSVLKGSVIFMADLMRAIDLPCTIDFMCVSSYGSGTKSSGVVKIIKDLDIDLHGKDLLIVEDILDSGKTLHYITKMLSDRGTASIPAEFVVGYGLDYDEKYRNLPYLGVLKPEIYGGK